MEEPSKSNSYSGLQEATKSAPDTPAKDSALEASAPGEIGPRAAEPESGSLAQPLALEEQAGSRASHGGTETTAKRSMKERILEELNEIWKVILYLAVCFSVIQTFRCATLLVRASENDFLTGYATAAIGALVVGKVVIVGEKLRFVNKLNTRPMIVPVLYKSVIFTILVNFIMHAEDRMMHRSHESFSAASDPLKFWVSFLAHQLAFFVTFFIFFTFREMQRTLGKGTMFKLFFHSREWKPPEK